MKSVVWLSVDPDIPASGYWDQCLLYTLLQPYCTFYDTGRVPDIDEAIVIIPGEYQGKYIEQINQELSKLKECKVIITSDEENNFPIDSLDHPNMKIYATYLTDKYDSWITWLPIGPARMPSKKYLPKKLDWFFAGQVNHDSRKRLVDVLRGMDGGELLTTKGFAQGYDHQTYYDHMAMAKVVPAPRGNISPDSFRFYEALELGAVPIPENESWWRSLFDDMPVEVITNWEDLPKYMEHPVNDLAYRNKCIAWWHRKKLEILDELIGQPELTVVIPVSPIKSHPSTEIIDETISSVRRQLPDARIVVTFDGVRYEQESRRADYNQFISVFLEKYNNANVYPMIFDDHTHQVGMMRAALNYVGSRYIVYVEQDTPFTDDSIDWEGCKRSLDLVDLIRFHFEVEIPQPHKYLMGKRVIKSPVPLLRTRQWSQRPHITTNEFYRKVLTNFSAGAKSFIEDKMHSVAQTTLRGYKLAIYYPKGSIKRSYHTDGRAGEAKWDDTQVF